MPRAKQVAPGNRGAAAAAPNQRHRFESQPEVPTAVVEDFALKGNTNHILHEVALPKRKGPHYEAVTEKTQLGRRMDNSQGDNPDIHVPGSQKSSRYGYDINTTDEAQEGN
jgi:hypothetical protein